MSKNICAKSRKADNPYEIWQVGTFTYRVLKKYQNPENEAKNPYARWFCSTDSPFVTGELGDTYVKDIVTHGFMSYKDPTLSE